MDELIELVRSIEERRFRWSALFYWGRGDFRVAVHPYDSKHQPPTYVGFGKDLVALTREAAREVLSLEAKNEDRTEVPERPVSEVGP